MIYYWVGQRTVTVLKNVKMEEICMYKLRKRIPAFFLLIIMTFGFLGQGQVAVQAADTTASTRQTLGRIKLEVYNIISKAPVAGVEFSVVDSTGKVIATPVTSPLGNVTADVPSGTYKVKQIKVPTGYIMNTAVQTLTIWGTGTAIATYYNQGTSTPTQPTTQTGQIRVNAYDISAGTPIGGVEFSVVDTSGKGVATLITDPSGIASVNLLPGSYQVKQTKTPAGYSLSGSVQTLTLWQNSIATATFYNQKVQPEVGQLKVKVYETNGTPLAGAAFTVTDAAGKVVSTVITNQSGEVLVNLPSGNYNVKQTKAPSGYAVYETSQTVTIWRNSMTTMTVYNPKAQPETGQFKIKLYDGTNALALAGGEFSITDASGKVVQTVTTGANGEGQVNLSIGNYQVKQTKAPVGYTSNTAVQSFTIVRGGTITSTFYNQKALPDTGQIKVRAYDINGAPPLAGVELAIVDSLGKTVATLVTNQNGEATATLPAGSYTVKQTKAPAGYDINPSTQSFVIFRSGVTTTTFYNQKAQPTTGQLKVSVYDLNSGSALQGAEFTVIDSTGKVITTFETNQTGTITLNVAPGTYRLKETKAPNGYDLNTSVQTITIVRGGTTTASFYNQKTRPNTGQLKVHVYDGDGVTSLAGAEFSVLNAAGESVGTLTTGANGEATITLPAGSYQLKETKAPAGYDLNSITQSLTVSQSGVTSIAFYNQKTRPASGKVTVRLYDSVSGSALAGAEFAVLDTSGKTIATVVTNQSGEGVLSLPAGNYRVKESKAPNGYQLNVASQMITVARDGMTTLTFYNQKTPSTTGQLKVNIYDSATGAAIKGAEFTVVDNAGKVVATMLTNQSGEATTTLPAGNYQVKETKVPAEYSMNTAAQSVTVWQGGVTTATFYNQKLQSKTGQLKVKLYDMVGGSPLVAGEFAVLDMSGKLITTIVTDQFGEATTTLPTGNYQVKEIKAPVGYDLNTGVRTLTVWQNGSTTATFYNQKIQPNVGNLTIKKYDESGEHVIAGANFEIIDSNGKVVAKPMTNPSGEVIIALVPGHYSIRDTKAVAAGLGDDSVIELTIDKGETHQVSFYNNIM